MSLLQRDNGDPNSRPVVIMNSTNWQRGSIFFCFSEYGAPEDSELKKQEPFALKNQLLSESSSLLLSLIYTVHNAWTQLAMQNGDPV